MNFEKLNNWLSLTANLGVLVGIIFLTYEIQQSNRIATSTTEIELRNQMGVINSAIYSDKELAEIEDQVWLGKTDFSTLETTRYSIWLVQLVNLWISIEVAYENGIAPERTYGVMFDSMNLYLAQPFAQDRLRVILTEFSSLSDTVVFQHIDEQLSKIGK